MIRDDGTISNWEFDSSGDFRWRTNSYPEQFSGMTPGTYRIVDGELFKVDPGSPPEPPKKIPHTCPVCKGRGKVPQGFYTAIGANDWAVSSTEPEQCRSCRGSGFLWGTA